jgi:YidC/Oxa1 family membrane protein insertase
MSNKSKLRDLIEFFLLFLALYFLTQLALQRFLPQYFGEKSQETGVILSMQDATVKGEHHPVAIIRNHTEEALTLADKCPMPPFDVWRIEGEERTALTTEETALPCVALTEVPVGDQVTYSLAPWKYSLFNEYTTYELVLPLPDAETSLTTRFTINKVGTVTQIFRTFITKPLLNLLILIASVMPGYNLGLAIIILTIIVKLLLFIPTQLGLEGQRKLQAIQPKLDVIKKKYHGNPQKIQEETMKIWKENKVNPFQSCLPMIIQFPVLIGLFFVIRDGSILELSSHLLYASHQNLSWSFGMNFLGLNLIEPSRYVMPPLLVIMQFAQMKLSFAIAKKKKKASKEGKEAKEAKDPQQMQQKMMLYGLPIMIGVFALQFPAAVSLYWGISTLFAIGQQLVVNRKEL